MEDRGKTKVKSWLLVAVFFLVAVTGTFGYARAVTLTDGEESWLIYMREEEKLARDVYQALFARWGLPVFSNIAASEQRHMDAIKTLLDRYGLADPAAGKAPGEFRNQDLQELYGILIERGDESTIEALRVGVEIEETDIDDLTAAIAAARRRDIKTVYTNLMNGSLNLL